MAKIILEFDDTQKTPSIDYHFEEVARRHIVLGVLAMLYETSEAERDDVFYEIAQHYTSGGIYELFDDFRQPDQKISA